MNQIDDPEVSSAARRSGLYRLLSESFKYPTTQGSDSSQKQKRSEMLELLQTENQEDNIVTREVQDLAASSGPEQFPVVPLEEEYNRLFAHLGSSKCPPYETEYGYENVFQKTQAMADIAGFYLAYGLNVSDTQTERVDFLSTELEYMSYLALHEAYARQRKNEEQQTISIDTQRKFLADHLGRWASLFVRFLKNSTENQFYLSCGRLLDAFLRAETQRLSISPEPVRVAKREAEPLVPFGCAECPVTK